MASKTKIIKGQKWQPKRGIQWAHVLQVMPTGRIKVEKFEPGSGEKGRILDIAEASLRRDYSLVEDAT